jgi:hypothetical protein
MMYAHDREAYPGEEWIYQAIQVAHNNPYPQENSTMLMCRPNCGQAEDGLLRFGHDTSAFSQIAPKHEPRHNRVLG